MHEVTRRNDGGRTDALLQDITQHGSAGAWMRLAWQWYCRFTHEDSVVVAEYTRLVSHSPRLPFTPNHRTVAAAAQKSCL